MTKIFPHCTISVGLAPLAEYCLVTCLFALIWRLLRYSDGSLFLLFPLALTLQLFSELTEEEATWDATTILTIQAEAVKEKGPVAHFSVCLSCIPFNSATSKCVDNTTNLRVSSSLHVASIAFVWEAFTNVTDTIRISPVTARFLRLHSFTCYL